MNGTEIPLSLILTRRLDDGMIEWISLEPGQRIPADSGAAYTLIDRTDYEAPQQQLVRREGDDLVVEASGTRVLVLEGFFAATGVAFYPTTDIAGGAGPFSGNPLTPDSAVLAESPAGEEIVWMAEPGAIDAPVASIAGSSGGMGSPMLWGGLAVAGLGLGAAAGGGGGGGESGSVSVSVATASAPPPDSVQPEITSATKAATIEENGGAEQVVYTATANQPVTWSLGSGGDGQSFSIDPDTGVVTLMENPDFETQASYTFSVIASDDSGNSEEQAVTLSIIDLDENDPVITSSSTASVNENIGTNQVVYTATATDETPVTWELETSDDFDIDPDTGQVTLTGNPNFETQASYSFAVIATDNAGNSSRQAVTLNISDLDENDPVITSGNTAAAIDENSGAGQEIYRARAEDENRITWSLGPDGDTNAFTIDADSGAVRLIENPEYDDQSLFNFTVIATDVAGNRSQQSVTLAIIETDDSAPTVVSVGITSAIGIQNGYLNAGDRVTVTVEMSETVRVDRSGGTPRIELDLGGDRVFADYVSGSGSRNLAFEYIVQPGDTDNNGIRIRSDSLDLNGGTISDPAGNPARLDHRDTRDDDDYRVDTTAPRLASSSPEDGDDDVDTDEDIVLDFSEDVLVGNGNITLSNGTDTRVIDVTDSRQISIDEGEVTIDPDGDLIPNSTYSVRIDGGTFTDAAGNVYTGISDPSDLQFETENSTNTSVVVFDLIQGSSSGHSRRDFQSDVSYDIYILVDSDQAALSTSGDGPGRWGRWGDADNLGSDDRIILVGDGSPVQARFFAVNRVVANSSTIVWESAFGFNAGSLRGESFIRATAGIDTVRLFDSTPPASFFSNQGGLLSIVYLTTMPSGILTSQGLV